MLCHQCGALIDDDARVCDNCGFKIESVQENIDRSDKHQIGQVPAVRTIEEEFAADNTKRLGDNIGVKVLSVLGAVVCILMFIIAANCVGAVNIQPQTQSFMGGIFGGSSAVIPIEFFIAIRYSFLGLGTALSAIILILGFKKTDYK